MLSEPNGQANVRKHGSRLLRGALKGVRWRLWRRRSFRSVPVTSTDRLIGGPRAAFAQTPTFPMRLDAKATALINQTNRIKLVLGC